MADHDSRNGVRYVTREVLAYVDALHAPHDEPLKQAFDAPTKEGMPAIQVGASEGKLLTLLLRMIGARRVVEIGTLAGYSAIRIAQALPPGGQVETIEADERHAAVARASVAASGLSDKVRVHHGAALDVLPALEAGGPYCAVFIDADKSRYADYGRWAARHVRPGGLLIGDNAFLFGRLLEDSDEGRAMRSFHEEARALFDTVCIPTPDGLLVGIRKG